MKKEIREEIMIKSNEEMDLARIFQSSLLNSSSFLSDTSKALRFEFLNFLHPLSSGRGWSIYSFPQTILQTWAFTGLSLGLHFKLWETSMRVASPVMRPALEPVWCASCPVVASGCDATRVSHDANRVTISECQKLPWFRQFLCKIRMKAQQYHILYIFNAMVAIWWF